MDAESTIALAFGVLGTATGAWGLTQASSANREARQANKLGRESNDLARQANDQAARAADVGQASNDIAARAADQAAASVVAAGEANTIAKQADERAKRLEAAQFELSDVAWAWHFDEHTDHWRVKNIGSTTAHNVRVILDVEGTTLEETADVLAAAEELFINLGPQASAERPRYHESVRRMDAAGITYFGSPSLRIRQRITWTSATGRPGVNDDQDGGVHV